jgi:hypothetical protein
MNLDVTRGPMSQWLIFVGYGAFIKARKSFPRLTFGLTLSIDR